jgi:acetate kinase
VVRAGAGARIVHLGVAVDRSRNDGAVLSGPGDPDTEITGTGGDVRTLVVRSREDLQIAAGVERVLAADARAVRAIATGGGRDRTTCL